MPKQALAAAAIVLTFGMFIPYIRAIRKGRVKPHLFSWIIWAAGTFTVFLAQLAGRGGAGAWPIGVSGLVTAYIAWLAWRHKTDASIRKADWAFLAVALAAVPCWLLTSDPLWAVLLLTGMDLAGFGPTFRAAYARPYDESPQFYALCAIRNAVSILALERHTLTTVLFPAAVGVACLLFVALVALRRALVNRPPAS